MLCSIIIPTFNREYLLQYTLDSILNQTYVNWECILVDDGSNDNTVEIIKKNVINDSRFRFYKRPFYLKKGANSCRNYGFSKISGDYVQWFDSDDIMMPKMIEEKINKINSDKSDIVIARLGFFKNKIEDFYTDDRINFESNRNNLPFDFFAGNFWFQTSQPLFRKTFLSSQKELFNRNLKRNQETELFVRLLIKNPKISYLNDILILQRIHLLSIGGFYGSMALSIKYLIDFPAYMLLFKSFLNTPYLTDEVLLFFKKYFNSCLNKMEFNFISMLSLILFGYRYNLFKSNILALKIFIFRALS
ncbi:MAG: glycosyltransferase family 2 protein [Chitinophagaceae bacterium]|nr:glycosyltransferase family 2 protein [Chitinophagaceae bacterium]